MIFTLITVVAAVLRVLMRAIESRFHTVPYHSDLHSIPILFASVAKMLYLPIDEPFYSKNFYGIMVAAALAYLALGFGYMVLRLNIQRSTIMISIV